MTFVCLCISEACPALGETISPGRDSTRSFERASRVGTAAAKAVPVASSWSNGTPSANGPRSGPQAATQPSSARNASQESGDAAFPIRDFFVEGNNLLSLDQVDAVLEPFKGPSRHFSDIEAARSALEKEYRKLGYPTVAVTVPEQTVEYGIITLKVYEARVEWVDIVDARFFSRDYILGKLPAVRPGTLLHEPTVLTQLDALNANPDLKVVPVLKPTDNPERLTLDLKVKDRPPLHGKLELNNRGVPTTPLLRLNAALQYTNVFGLDHAITLQTSQTPQEWGDVQVYSGNYLIPLGADHQLVFYGATARSRARLDQSPLPVGGGLDIIGNSVIGGGRYFFPVGSGETMKHQLYVGLDYKHLDRAEGQVPGTSTTVTVNNAISYTPASLGYNGVRPDDWGFTKLTGMARGYVAGLVSGGSQEDFQGNSDDVLNMPGFRRGATGTFVVLQGGVDRYQKLPREFSLTAKADGQWGSEPLIPTEQYFAGGMESVRGYFEFEAVGDNAAHASVEVMTPAMPKWPLENINRALRFVAFYDLAYLWIKDPLPGQVPRWKLEGTGVGLRFSLSDYVRFRYDAAWALSTGPFSPAGSFFGHFSIEGVF